MRLPSVLLALLPVLAASAGCAGSLIPNTDVEDTADNREAVEFVEQYRHAVEARDVAALMSLASERYHDDNGTPSADDDIDYGRLRDKLGRWTDSVLDVRYEIRYRRVTRRTDRVYVDYTYTGSFRLSMPGGDRWARRLADNRLVLALEGDGFRIVSGM